jgi:hypothetical protein
MCMLETTDSRGVTHQHRINGSHDLIKRSLIRDERFKGYFIRCKEACCGCRFFGWYSISQPCKCLNPKVNPEIRRLLWADKPIHPSVAVSATSTNPQVTVGLLSN